MAIPRKILKYEERVRAAAITWANGPRLQPVSREWHATLDDGSVVTVNDRKLLRMLEERPR